MADELEDPFGPLMKRTQVEMNAQAYAHQAMQAAQNHQLQYAQAPSGGFASIGAQARGTQYNLAQNNDRARRLLISRLGGVTGDFVLQYSDFLHCQVYKDEVFVFFLLNGKDGIVRERVDIFPSDQLVGQFRMVIAA